jgi:hypothetical protein
MFEFFPTERYTTNDKIVFAGALAMAAGTFFPIIRLPLVGTLNYLARGQGDGTIVLLLSGAAAAAVYYGFRRIASLAGMAALIVMMVTLANLMQVLSKFRGATADNPFTAIIASSAGLEWGWLPLIGGAFAVIGGGVASRKILEPSQTSTNGRPQNDDDWAQSMDEKIARYAQEKANEKQESARQKSIPQTFGKRLHS